MQRLSAILAALCLLLTAGSAHADSIPVSGMEIGGNPGRWAPGHDSTVGYEFEVLGQDIEVTDLGFYDSQWRNDNFFWQNHFVGIWDSSGDLVVSTTLGYWQTSYVLDGNFRYAELAVPVTLLAGETYTVGGSSPGTRSPLADGYAGGASINSIAPGIAILRRTYADGVGVLPDQGSNLTGGNFRFVTVVPLPPAALLGLGMLGAFGLVARRRKRKAGQSL